MRTMRTARRTTRTARSENAEKEREGEKELPDIYTALRDLYHIWIVRAR